MKKLLCAVLVVALVFLCATVCAALTVVLCGDANNDGEVDTKDVLTARLYIAELSDSIHFDGADANNDGVVNTKDVLIIRRAIAELDPISSRTLADETATGTATETTATAITTIATTTTKKHIAPTVAPTAKPTGVLATGTVMRIDVDHAETFSGEVKGDYSSPFNAYLPKSTVDVLKKTVTDPETGLEYYLLGCGRRVYVDSAVTVQKKGTLTENYLQLADVTITDDATILTLNSTWHIPFQLQLLPQEYPYSSQMGEYGPKYDVTNFEAEYVELTFYYTTLAAGPFDFSDCPVFRSSSWQQNSNNTYNLKLNLREAGGFYGYSANWVGDQLVLSFKHKTDISKNTDKKPLAGMTIVVDAGHGGEWSGTYGAIDGVYEKTLTLDYAKTLRATLEDLGATVVMTRTTDVKVELEDVAALTRKTSPDLFISIHMDGVDNPDPNGPSVHYFTEYSYALAKAIVNRMDKLYNSHKETTYRGARWNPYYVTRISDCPAVLIECGFLTNYEEETLLLNTNFRKEVCAAIADGVVEFQKNLP